MKLSNLIEGGAQERGRRAGTENVPGIVAMAAALKEYAAAVKVYDENGRDMVLTAFDAEKALELA